MKPRVDRATTSRILGDIADAVRPVERARTAAAVERVLATAAPCIFGTGYSGVEVTEVLCLALGIEPAEFDHYDDCDCDIQRAYPPRECATPGFYLGASPNPGEAERLAPWVVSPHLFPATSAAAQDGVADSPLRPVLSSAPGAQVQSTRPCPRREAAAAAPTPAALDTRPPENADARVTPPQSARTFEREEQ